MADFVNHGDVEYHGGCHCGAARFRFTGPERLDVLECNCSICSMTGYLHVTVPHAAFTLLTPTDALAEYRFCTGAARHLFCRHCGVKSFYVPRSHPDGYSVNVRCLDPGSVVELRIAPFDDSDREAATAAVAHLSRD